MGQRHQLLRGMSPAFTANPKNESRNMAQLERIGYGGRSGSQRRETKPTCRAGDQDERDRDRDGASLAHRQHDVAGPEVRVPETPGN